LTRALEGYLFHPDIVVRILLDKSTRSCMSVILSLKPLTTCYIRNTLLLGTRVFLMLIRPGMEDAPHSYPPRKPASGLFAIIFNAIAGIST